MSPDPIQADDLRELLAAVAVELVQPVNDSLRQLYEVLRDPAPVLQVAGPTQVAVRDVSAAGGPVRLLAADPTRLGVYLGYDTAPGSGVVYFSPTSTGTLADSIRLPSFVTAAWLPYDGEVWAWADPALVGERPVIAQTFHRPLV